MNYFKVIKMVVSVMIHDILSVMKMIVIIDDDETDKMCNVNKSVNIITQTTLRQRYSV